jgi:hypothetical protein
MRIYFMVSKVNGGVILLRDRAVGVLFRFEEEQSMDILLMVDPENEQAVADTIDAVDPTLLSAKPEHREHMDAQHLVSFALHVASNLDPISVAVGALIAKHITVRVEVDGIPLTAKTFKQGLSLLRQLQELLSGETKKRKHK